MSAREWHHGPLDRSGIYKYLHLIWADDDPKRSPRPKGGRKDKTPHHTFNKMTSEELQTAIVDHLWDEVPRTFNRICVELWDKNASTLFSTKADKALWALVEEGVIEHTLEQPVYFRLREQENPCPKPS